MKVAKHHIPLINTLRGIAAVLVCLYHFVCKTIDFISDGQVYDLFKYGQKGVQLFFVISAVVIPISLIKSNYRLKKFKWFFIRRFIRIEIPYVVSILACIVFLIMRNFGYQHAIFQNLPSIDSIFLHLGYLISLFDQYDWINQVYWTLAIEFQYYIFLGVFFSFAMHSKLLFRMCFYLAVVLLSLWHSRANFPFWAPYFALGNIYVLFRYDYVKTVEFLVVTLLFSVFCYLNLGFLDLGIAYLGLLLIHFLGQINLKGGNFFGKISYSLYLIHGITGAAVVNILSRFANSGLQKAGVVGFGFLVALTASYVFWRFIERPSQSLSRSFVLPVDGHNDTETQKTESH